MPLPLVRTLGSEDLLFLPTVANFRPDSRHDGSWWLGHSLEHQTPCWLHLVARRNEVPSQGFDFGSTVQAPNVCLGNEPDDLHDPGRPGRRHLEVQRSKVPSLGLGSC